MGENMPQLALAAAALAAALAAATLAAALAAAFIAAAIAAALAAAVTSAGALLPEFGVDLHPARLGVRPGVWSVRQLVARDGRLFA